MTVGILDRISCFLLGIKIYNGPIEVGDTFIFKSDNPWGERKVKIIDKKEGWVKYKNISIPYAPVWTEKEDVIRKFYKKEIEK